MKRLLCVFCVFIFIIALCSCNNKNKKNTSSFTSSGNVSAEINSATSSLSMSSETSSILSSQVSNSEIPTISNEFLQSLDNKKQGWGPGKTVSHVRPSSPASYQNKYGKYDASFIGKDEKVIYLTFDEGYENGYTASILDSLKEKNVSAVFFVTYPYAKQNPQLIKRMIDEGHIVGNHSVNHPSFPTVNLEKAKNEIMVLHDYIKDQFNYEMTLFRFPMGEYSEQMLALVQSLGYKSVFWSFAYVDWDVKNQIGADKAFDIVTTSTHNGAIYLLHAVSKDNAEILGRVIDDIRNQGYTISKYDI